MVKTGSQNSKNCAATSTIITEGVVTRSQKQKKQKHTSSSSPPEKALKKKILPNIVLTDRIKQQIKKRQLCRKQIHQNQTSILNEIHTDMDTTKTQNNQEMTSIWKNFESVFKYIDEFMSFKKRVERNSIYLI
jgi:hypothetical protein